MDNEQKQVEGITFSELEIQDMQRACKLAMVEAVQQKDIDYDFILRLADLHRRFERFIWIMERGV